MRVVLAGASGFIGTALADSLSSGGHQVSTLVRRPVSGPDVDSWDPLRGRLDPDFLADADAVVCLSGAGVGSRRWTAAYKQRLAESRVASVATIARTLADYGGPRVLVAASAVGYYGDTGDRTLTEQAPAGTTFLAGVCTRWEAAADPARAAGVRVAHIRSGVVLSPDGGMLKPLKALTQFGLAGKVGTGRQYLSWISLRDEIRAIEYLLTHDVSGPVNLTGPNPVRNAEFVATLGQVLHRPTVLTAPAFAVRAGLGEFAGELLGGQRALPAVLTDAGFEFEHTDLEPALRWALGR